MPTTQGSQPAPAALTGNLEALNRRISACSACPRLAAYRERIGAEKRAAFRDQTYWAKPVPNLLPTLPAGETLGDVRVLIVGLAPAAHGANRTGRMFTGDRSGDFLFAALHRAGLASQPTSVSPGDGLRLIGAAMTAACHCAPPDNKPLPEELAACAPFLRETFDALLPTLRVVLTLGKIGHDAALGEYLRRGWIARRSEAPFGHGVVHRFGTGVPAIVGTYHPSQQNTFTGRLTPAMLDSVLADVNRLALKRSSGQATGLPLIPIPPSFPRR